MSTLQHTGDKMCLNWLENVALIQKTAQNEHLMCSGRNSQSCGFAWMSIICNLKHGGAVKYIQVKATDQTFIHAGLWTHMRHV